MTASHARPRPLYRRFWTLLRLPLADKWLLTQVYLLLGVTRLAINLLPFPRLEPMLGQRLVETPDEAPLDDLRAAHRIGRAIAAISPFTPWASNCFPQALTAKILLRRRGIVTTLYLGAAFVEGGGALEGHAWLRCGPMFVTGGDGSHHFGAIVAFGE